MKLRIREAMDSSIPSWLRKTMSTFGKPINRGRYSRTPGPSDFSAKVDIANTTYHDLPIPRTSQEFNKLNKDPNRATVVHFKDIRGNDVVWVVGFNDPEVYLDEKDIFNSKPASRHAAKNILPRVIDYGYVEFSDDIADLRKSRAVNRPDDRDRSKAQHLKISHKPDYKFTLDGKVYAQGPSMQTWEAEQGYDKSGYPIAGLDKYRKMLASMGLRNYDRTMDRIYDSYTGLVDTVRLCKGNRRKFSAYRNLTNVMMKYLDDVENYYNDYMQKLELEKENPEYGTYLSKDRKSSVEDCLKRLREYAKKADEFVSHLMSDDWTDEDYSDFDWRI
jgi:hypothetical protein